MDVEPILAAHYAAEHPVEAGANALYFNKVPIADILQRQGVAVPWVVAGLRNQPDVTNTFGVPWQIFELKASGERNAIEGLKDLDRYLDTFALAGVPATGGPSTDPGVNFDVPFAGGELEFHSEVDGLVQWDWFPDPEQVPDAASDNANWQLFLFVGLGVAAAPAFVGGGAAVGVGGAAVGGEGAVVGGAGASSGGLLPGLAPAF
jgi:hypothetical protein